VWLTNSWSLRITKPGKKNAPPDTAWVFQRRAKTMLETTTESQS